MHEETYFLQRKIYVGTSECQVPKCTGKFSIKSRIRDRWACVGRKFLFGINWSQAWVAVGHVCSVKNIRCIVLLMKLKTISVSLYGNVEEVMSRALIGHFKLGTECGNDALQEACRRGGEDDVIYVEEKIHEV